MHTSARTTVHSIWPLKQDGPQLGPLHAAPSSRRPASGSHAPWHPGSRAGGFNLPFLSLPSSTQVDIHSKCQSAAQKHLRRFVLKSSQRHSPVNQSCFDARPTARAEKYGSAKKRKQLCCQLQGVLRAVSGHITACFSGTVYRRLLLRMQRGVCGPGSMVA